MHAAVPDDRDRLSPDWELPPEPPIHRAARKGDLETLAQLLGAGANIDEPADIEIDNGPHLRGLTPLMVAARSIDGATTETLRWLVERSADIGATSEGGNTAAWYAAGHGARWDFHAKAVTPDHVERLRFLLDQGMDPNECNFIGQSLITEACEAGDPARVRLLLERGVSVVSLNPQSKQDSFQLPLFCASSSGSAECVRLILEGGAHPNQRDSLGATALMEAGSVEVIKVFLDAGADRHATSEGGADALQFLLDGDCENSVCSPERLQMTRAFVEAGADIERVDQYGMSRLAVAAFGHHDDSVACLLSLGASPHALDSSGGTSLHAICWQGEYHDEVINEAGERIVNLLLKAGASVNSKDQHGSTPLHEAAYGDWGNPTAVRLLLRFGADPDPVDHDGDSPLMLAAMRGEVECIKFLLNAGANPIRRNKKGRTAIDAAKKNLAFWEEDDGADVDEIIEEVVHTALKKIATDFGGEVSKEEVDEIVKSAPSEDHLACAKKSLALLLNAAKRADGRRYDTSDD